MVSITSIKTKDFKMNNAMSSYVSLWVNFTTGEVKHHIVFSNRSELSLQADFTSGLM